jgi:hypothetical protein
MSLGTRAAIRCMAPRREEEKEGGGGVLVVRCWRLAKWKAGKAEDRRLAMLENTGSPETSLSSWRT